MIALPEQTTPARTTPAAWFPALVLFESTNAVSMQYILFLCIGFAILALGLFFMNRYQKKKALEEGEFLERPSVIHSVLSAALDARSRVDIFLGGNRYGQPLSGCIEHLSSKNLFIVLPSSKLPAAVRTARLHFYFYLGTGADKTFYHFTGTALEFTHHEERFGMEVPLPKALNNAQKREFLRINPGPGMVEAALLWKMDPNIPLPGAAQHLGSPHFSYRPPKSAQMAVVDISGGGVLLRLSGERIDQLKEHFPEFCLGDTFCMLLLLHDLDSDKIFPIWLTGLCRRIISAPHSSNLDVGLQFTHWAVVEKTTSPITWTSVHMDGEVPRILAWTLRIQTYLTRKSR